MKTIKQIREEYDNVAINQIDDLSDEIVLEAAGNPFSNRVPSSKEMPIMLIFKRIQFRAFPDKTTVAMYYCRALNKYLTIPFGPKGNVNLGEATLIDADMLSEDWQSVNRKDKTDGLSQAAVNAYRRENPGSKLQTAVTEKNPSGKRAARRKSFCSRMGGMKKRLTSAKTARDPDSRINKALRRWNCEEAFRAKLEEKRQERLDEMLPLVAGALEAGAGLVARAAASRAAGAVVSGATRAASTASRLVKRGAKALGKRAIKSMLGGSKPKPGEQQAQPETMAKERPQATVKSYTASDIAKNRASDTVKSIEAQAARKHAKSTLAGQVQENKISDIRAMIDNDGTLHEMLINGRTITLNNSMAKRILEVYDSVNTKNKKVVESMLNEDLETFKKLLNFSIKV